VVCLFNDCFRPLLGGYQKQQQTSDGHQGGS
jgi:hypothetical protein